MTTSPRAHARRLAFRFAETTHYLDRALATGSTLDAAAAYDHARALWAIALRIPRRDVATLLTGDPS